MTKPKFNEQTTADKFDFQTAVDLADFREGFRPVGSGPLGVMRVAFDLCTLLAKERGWDLEAVLPESIEQRRVRYEKLLAEQAQESEARRQAEHDRRIKNYIKKHGPALLICK